MPSKTTLPLLARENAESVGKGRLYVLPPTTTMLLPADTAVPEMTVCKPGVNVLPSINMAPLGASEIAGSVGEGSA